MSDQDNQSVTEAVTGLAGVVAKLGGAVAAVGAGGAAAYYGGGIAAAGAAAVGAPAIVAVGAAALMSYGAFKTVGTVLDWISPDEKPIEPPQPPPEA